jgi:uncharacterized alpha-E superfamily protein
VLSRENPRSLGWVVQTLRARLSRLAGSASNETGALAQLVPDPGNWSLDALCDGSAARPALRELLDACHAAAWRLSDEVSLRYCTHTQEAGESLGA